MRILDTTHNKRIPIFLEMARRMSLATDPNDVLHAYLAGMSGAYGPEAYVRLYREGLPPGHFRLIRVVEEGIGDEVQSMDEVDLASCPVEREGFLAEMVRSDEPKLALDLNLRDDPVLGSRMAEYGSALAIPMFMEGEAANWVVMFHKGSNSMTDLDLEESVVRINMLGSNIRTALIARQLHDATQFIQREVETIAELQRALLPPEMPRIPGLSVAAHYETFDRAGGDYYDFRPLRMKDGVPDPKGPWAVIIADAAGHGPAAAVVMAMLRALFQSYPKEPDSPSEMLEHFNAHLQSPSLRYVFVTAFLAIFDPVSGVLRYARAGHDAPILMAPGSPEPMSLLDAVNGFPLGVGDAVTSPDTEFVLQAGQTLVLYTDGITEAQSPSGEIFRTAGVEKALLACDGVPECVIQNVVTALKTHEGGVRPRDDQTIVALQCRKP